MCCSCTHMTRDKHHIHYTLSTQQMGYKKMGYHLYVNTFSHLIIPHHIKMISAGEALAPRGDKAPHSLYPIKRADGDSPSLRQHILSTWGLLYVCFICVYVSCGCASSVCVAFECSAYGCVLHLSALHMGIFHMSVFHRGVDGRAYCL